MTSRSCAGSRKNALHINLSEIVGIAGVIVHEHHIGLLRTIWAGVSRDGVRVITSAEIGAVRLGR